MSPDHRHPNLWTYYACLVGVGLMVGILGPLLPWLSQQTHSGLPALSLILAMRPLGYLGGSHYSGRWLDRRPGHPLMAASALVCAASLALMPLTPILAFLALLVLIMGFAQGLLDVSSNTLLVWLYREKAGPYLIGLHLFFGFGAILGPLLVAQALKAGNYQWTFWVLALCLLPLVLPLLAVPDPAHTAATSDEAAPAPDKALLALFIAYAFLYGGCEAGFGSWIYTYAVAMGLADPARAAYLTSLFWCSVCVARLIALPLVHRLRPTQVIAALLPVGLLAQGAFQRWPTSPWVLWAATAGTGFSFSCLFPSLLNYAGLRLSGKARVSAKLTSTLFVGLALGAMTLPWVMGQVIPTGPKAALGLVLGALTSLTIVFILIIRRPQA